MVAKSSRGSSTFDLFRSFLGTALASRLRAAPIRYFSATIEGLEHLPSQGGALLVGNHAMTGLDGVVLGALVRESTGRDVRFLGERNLWRVPLLGRALDAVGAVPGERDTAVRLLRDGEVCGVYPGGIDDSWKLASERYRLQWGERRGFARVAIAAGVPIVPVVGLGIDEMYDVVARERWVGRRLLGHARYDLPLALGWKGTPIPRPVPQRYVVLPPIDTRGDAERAEDVDRVRDAAFEALEGELAKARG